MNAAPGTASTQPSKRRLTLPRIALGAVAFVLAPGLFAFAVFGLGDGSNEARLTAQTRSELGVRAVEATWEAARTNESPLFGFEAREVSVRALGSMRSESVSQSAHATDDVERARLHLLAARTAAQNGRSDAALESYRLAIAAGGSSQGRALVEFAGLGPSGEALRSALARVPFASTVDGVPARSLALIAAGGRELDAQTVLAEAAALKAALADGTCRPKDFASALGTQLSVALDPTWLALHELMRTHAAPSASAVAAWVTAFDERGRRGAALARAALEHGGESHVWSLWRLDSGEFYAARLRGPADGTTVGGTPQEPGLQSMSIIEGAGVSFDAALTQRSGIGDELRLAALAPATGGNSRSSNEGSAGDVAAVGQLAGSAIPVHVSPADPAALLGAARLRQNGVRGILAAAAILIALASWLALRALSRAERLRSLRSTFVATVSHDLRTPIAAIGLLAENLREGHAPDRQADYVTSIELETSRLARLVDDLLDFGRIERGLPPRIRPSTVDVGAWLDAFFEQQRAQVRRHGKALSTETHALPVYASIDRVALERAIANLIDNAMRHSGTETIRVHAAGHEDGTLRIEVSDDGTGLPRGTLAEDLFEPFARAGHGTSAGTGLGLAIVRAVAEAHGGSATLVDRAQSSSQAGILASITVPTNDRSAA